MKNSNDTIGNRTRDRLACSAVPQPTAPPRAPLKIVFFLNVATMKAYGAVEVQLRYFFALLLDGGEWSPSLSGRFAPGRRDTPASVEEETGWATEPVWTAAVKKKPFAPAWIRNTTPRSPVRSLVTVLTELSRLFAWRI
jgi:hypothetical protein